ncbi:hypothetical protein CAPTEDRAFT_195048 [Capitella teleta]|uniref:Aminopeptidase n=1 Tax=Capitella teleta TaxID=283909 RepID=R7UI80_CAPTE|nr:hypothetical protein CAPTEDRAFT_195048 [Capitella teleta]|eukprot:ELU05920.1 hypothetical protein CAPTEDRAFT_195048 [Capitella teleta]
MAKIVAILLVGYFVGILADDPKTGKYYCDAYTDPNPLFNNGVAPKNLEDGRLPTTIEPVHYDLEIRPDIYTGQPPFINTGHVDIIMRPMVATNQIVLNYESLTLFDDTMRLASIDSPNPAPSIVGWGVLPDLDFLVITLDSDLVPGTAYSFSVTFAGELVTAAVRGGLYWDTYVKNGETIYVIGSQLQRIYARRIFPVFDEPSFKATFNITIGRKAPYSAVGNGALLESEEVEDGWVLDHFESTPHMSCYLLAFVVVDFGYLETVTPSGTVSRLWVRDDALEAAEFSNNIIGPITEWLESYTDYRNIIPIVDHVVLPTHSGAMENWGLIIYGESSMLWNETWYSAHYRSTTAYIIGHELAHFWFGNLVTCDWWSDTWLNEGFASYFESKSLEPLAWKPSEMTYHLRVKGMFRSDTISTSYPVRPTIVTPWEAPNAFTTSSYSKGASMLRMIETIMTPETFKRAIQLYLRDFQFSNAVTDDLWAVLTHQAAQDGITDPDGSPLDLKERFDPWVLQSGYPLIRTIRNYETGSLTLSQKQFNPNDEEWPDSEFDYSWHVPISILNEDDESITPRLVTWMSRVPAIVLDESMPSETNEWYLVNPGTRFFYRVQYDSQNMANLNRQLNEDHLVFDVETRAALIEDTFALARAGVLTLVDGFETSLYLKAETEGVPWLTFDYYQPYIALILRRFPATNDLYRSFIRETVRPVYESKGWDFDWDEDIYQEMAVRLSCTNDNTNCLLTNAIRFNAWKELPASQNPVVVGLRPSFYCTAVRRGDAADWTAIYNRYKEDAGTSHLPFDSIEKRTLLESLACSANVQVLQDYLVNLYDDDFVGLADKSAAMESLASSITGRDVVWEHLRQNWRKEPVPSGVSSSVIFHTVVEGFASEADELELIQFVARYPPENATEEALYDRAAEILSENQKWANLNVNALHDWLSSNVMD